MSKALLFSDLHCYAHKKQVERLQHCLDVLNWVFETAKEKKIPNIIFAGDLFHDRKSIDVLTYQRTFEIFQKYMSDKSHPNVYLLLGNHDLWYYEKTDISSVYPFAVIEGVTVISQPSTIDIGGFPVSFLPYTHDPEADLKKILNDAKNKILFGHVAIDGAIWNTTYKTVAEVSIEHDGDMKKVTPDIFKDWDKVFLGHYHAEQKLAHNVEYIGSPLQLNFGEAYQTKHIIEFDLKTLKKTYIENTFSPKHFVITPDEKDNYDLKNFIRVVVDDLTDPDVIELRRELSETALSLEFKQKEKGIKEQIDNVKDAKSILGEGDVLEKYLEVANIGSLDKDKLLNIGKKIIELSTGN